MKLRAMVLSLLALASVACSAHAEEAADYPSKKIKMLLPFGAGGGGDVLGRLLADRMGNRLGQTIYVENRTGAAGTIGAQLAATSPPDGYTITIGGMTTHVLAPALNKNIGFDPIQDFTHIAYIGGSPSAFVVHPSTGVKTFEEFMKWVKDTPGGVQYVSPGVGSGGNSVAEFFAAQAGIKLVHVPHRGGNTAVSDLIGGHVKMGSLTWSTAREHVSAGTLLPIAVSSGEPIAGFTNVPTFKEKGYPEVVTTVWLSLSGPRGLPDEITNKLNAEVNRIIQLPHVKEHLERDAFDIRLMSPAEMTQHMKNEYAKWVPAMRKALNIN
jgi:tripartite-type tricarboxylate transporter receptor subunit TctC